MKILINQLSHLLKWSIKTQTKITKLLYLTRTKVKNK